MRDGGLAGINRRWCPECLLEAGESDGLSERLIWNFLHYSHCSLHSVRIIDRCQECGNSQQLRRGNAATCAYCGCSLARAATHERPSALQSWANASIEDVVRWTATNPDVVIPAENYQRFFDGLLQDGTLDRLKIVHNRFWRDAIRFRRTTTTFRTLLNLSAIKSVDIIGILTEPVPASSTSLFPGHEVDGEIAFDLEDWGLRRGNSKSCSTRSARPIRVCSLASSSLAYCWFLNEKFYPPCAIIQRLPRSSEATWPGPSCASEHVEQNYGPVHDPA